MPFREVACNYRIGWPARWGHVVVGPGGSVAVEPIDLCLQSELILGPGRIMFFFFYQEKHRTYFAEYFRKWYLT